jgi:hypothetical protein
MDEKSKRSIGRRDLLRLVTITGVAAGVTDAASNPSAPAAPKTVDRGKRKALYQPNAAEVQRFYRVNSYPPK